MTHVNVEFFFFFWKADGLICEKRTGPVLFRCEGGTSWEDVENEKAGRRDAVESNRRIGRVQVARAAVHFT